MFWYDITFSGRIMHLVYLYDDIVEIGVTIFLDTVW